MSTEPEPIPATLMSDGIAAAENAVLQSDEFKALVEAVNSRRYRGPDGDQPMEDRYCWSHYGQHDRIAEAALRLVVKFETKP